MQGIIVECLCGGKRARDFPTASRHKALHLQSVRPTRLMCHRYSYGSSAECLEECTRGRMYRRGTSNKRVCSKDIEGQLRKEPFGFEQSHSASSREVRKVRYHSEANTSRDERL